ncbi:MAG TPA: PD-(D/E)XK nuclease family protein [Polyangiaceae bacterium]
MKHRLSASGLARGRRCLWWARGEIALPDRPSSSEAKLGTAVHAAIAAHIDGLPERPAAFSDDLDDAQVDAFDRILSRWAEWWPKASGGLAWKAEVPVAWNVRTGAARLLPRDAAHRDYGELDDDEIPGTVDACAVDDGRVSVIDWKTGRQQVESPATNPQLAHNGAALAAVHGASEARVTYTKLGEEAIFSPEPAVLDAISFEATRDELRTMIDSIATSEPRPGPWCTWCPAKGVCPETAVAVEQVIEATAIVRRVPMSLEIRDNAHAAGMLTAVDAVEQFVDELRRRLKAYADANGGIAMPDGTVYSRTDVTTERPDLSVEAALAVIEQEALADAVKHSITWSEIKKRGGAEAEKRVRAALRKLGAVKVTTTQRYEAKAKKERAA